MTDHFQTELAIDTNMVVTDTNVVVTDTKTMVAKTQTMVAETQAVVADMRRDMLTGHEGTSGKIHPVCSNLYQ